MPPAEPAVIITTAAIGAFFVLAPGLWPLARNLVTVLHEGGHGIMALLTGRQLSGIRLHSDTSGLTTSRGKPRGFGMILTLLAGYPAASSAGIGAAFLLSRQLPLAVLWSLLALMALMLLKIRNFYGLWVILVLGAGVFALTWWASPQIQLAAAYAITWFLLLAGPRPVIEMSRQRRTQAASHQPRARTGNSDADQLGRLTWLPAPVWVALFFITTLAAAIGGAYLLARPLF